jgi:Family of unknown function (DUF6173)
MTMQGSQPPGPVRRVSAQLIEPGDAVRAAARSPAESMYQRLMKYIGQFELQLDRDHEVGGRFVQFGDDRHFHIADVGYWNPDIITFDGFDNAGNRVKLIQHVTQLNVLLVALRKMAPPAEPPRRIGFDLGDESEDAKPPAAPR